MIRLIWSPNAIANLNAIRTRIAQENPGAAQKDKR